MSGFSDAQKTARPSANAMAGPSRPAASTGQEAAAHQPPQRSASGLRQSLSVAGSQVGHFVMGDCLGRGAFGQVYRALNWTTGETVAIKQVKLTHIPESELGEIMSEIELLRNLKHPNIVKYKGSEKTRDFLYIILEYCENGSLHNICKRFGKFPEGLVGVYISQVLEGLLYLHDQGVIHRDIKGANILTNKDGSVKLADFGVATRTGAMSDYAVVGSPYWMAPEVIDQSGATTASDIWSVGCVVIELLEGKPPYHYLDPMPALFRIVQDDCPPLPDGASPIVKDFLGQCFQKDANLRVSARKLLRHPWMMGARKQLEQMRAGGSMRAGSAPGLIHDEAVKTVQEWNEATKDPPRPPPRKGIDSATFKPPLLQQPRKAPAVAAETTLPGRSTPTKRAHRPAPAPPTNDRALRAAEGALPHQPVAEGMMSPKGAANLQRAKPLLAMKDQRSHLELHRPDESGDNWDDDFEEGIPSTKIAALPAPVAGTLAPSKSEHPAQSAPPAKTSAAAPVSAHLAPAPPSIQLAKYVEKDDEFAADDDDFDFGDGEDDFKTIRPPPRPKTPPARNVSNGQAPPKQGRVAGAPPVRGRASPKASPPVVLSSLMASTTLSGSSDEVEDYSDLFGEEQEGRLHEKILQLQKRNSSGNRLFHPNDIRSVAKTFEAPEQAQAADAPQQHRVSSQSDASDGHNLKRKPSMEALTQSLLASPAVVASLSTSPSDTSNGSSRGQLSPTQSRHSSLRLPRDEKRESMRRSLGRYSEGGDEDYSDLFDGPNTNQDLGAGGVPTLQLTQRLSSRSWLGDEDDENDPFAEIDEDFGSGADLESNLARDKHARTCAYLVELVEGLRPGVDEEQLLDRCEQIEQILTETPETKPHLLSAHGALSVLELLEVTRIHEVTSRLLGLLNIIAYDDPPAQETLCLVGAIPVVMGYTAKKYPHAVRIEAAHFVFTMCSTSPLTLQFVLSCRGLRTLVELIDEDFGEHRDLVWLGVGCVNSVLALQSPASRNDFCRMLAQEGLLEPLSTILICVVDEGIDDEYSTAIKENILQTFLIFSSSDVWLKKKVATRSVLRRMLQACSRLEPRLLILMLKCIKSLSMSPNVLDELQNANTIDVLTRILADQCEGTHGTEMSNQILNAMYNLCRLNKSRQEEAAQSGVIPHLMRVVRSRSPFKQFALPILCDFAHASKATRKVLNQHGGLDFYRELLADPYWQSQALEAILVWMQEETSRVEDVLIRPSSVEALLGVFTTATTNSFENLLEPFLKIFRLSSRVAHAVGKNPAFLKRLISRLSHGRAVVRLNLLRITKLVCDAHPDRQGLIAQYRLLEIIDKLSRDDAAILVRELAKEILGQLQQPPPTTPTSAFYHKAQLRRAASENNVGGGPAMNAIGLGGIAGVSPPAAGAAASAANGSPQRRSVWPGSAGNGGGAPAASKSTAGGASRAAYPGLGLSQLRTSPSPSSVGSTSSISTGNSKTSSASLAPMAQLHRASSGPSMTSPTSLKADSTRLSTSPSHRRG